MDYSVFQILLDAVWVIDAGRRFVFLNDAAALTLGVPLRRVKLGTPMADWIQWEDPTLFCMPGGTWGQAQRTVYREVAFQSKQGKTGRAQVSIQPVAETGHWMVLARDVTLEESLHRKYRLEIDAKEKAFAELRAAHDLLEQKVFERTAQLSELNRTLAAMMNSLGQGFLVVDSAGRCSSIHSKACLDLLEADPSGRFLSEVLRLEAPQATSLRSWLELAFSEKLSFEDLRGLGPARFAHSQGRRILLEYHAIRGEDRRLAGIVLVATDRTREWEAEQATQEEKQHARRIVSILRSKTTFVRLWRSLKDLESNLSKLDNGSGTLTPAERKNWMRTLHTYKGEAASFYLSEIVGSLHGLEDDIQSFGGKVRSLASLRDTLARFEKEQLPELGIDVARAGEDREVVARESDVVKLRAALEGGGLSKGLLESFDDQLLRAPISSWLPQWEAGLETSCRVAGKLVELKSDGIDQVRVDPARWNPVADALVHVFRNIADHGLELPEDREKVGKTPMGRVVLEAARVDEPAFSGVVFTISDDGLGIDIERLRERIGKPSLTDDEVLGRLLQGGLSSKGSVSSLSGRGVGLEAVTHVVCSLGGEIRIHTVQGKGTRLTLKIPDGVGPSSGRGTIKAA